MEEKYTTFTKHEKTFIKVILWGMILILSFVLIFSYILSSKPFAVSELGAIGDTVGGLTAPFINLLAAFLVYKSFVAQIRANQDQVYNHQEQMNLLSNEIQYNQLRNVVADILDVYTKKELEDNSFSFIIGRLSSHDSAIVFSNLEPYKIVHPNEIMERNRSLESTISNLEFLKEFIDKSSLSDKQKTSFYFNMSHTINNNSSNILKDLSNKEEELLDLYLKADLKDQILDIRSRFIELYGQL